MKELEDTWEEIRGRLIHYVRNKVDADVAEDIVHDILLRVVKHQDTLFEADQPMAWIYAVAKNRITDHYRQQSKSKIESAIEHEEYFGVDIPASLDVIDGEFLQCLRPLLDRLDPKYSEALQLVDFDDMKQTEVATQLGISLPAMKSRVQRARVHLKDEFLDCCSVEMNRFGRVTGYHSRRDRGNKDCC